MAQFRCDEISTLVVEAFLASAKIVRKPVDGGSVVEGLGALMRDWLETALGTLRDFKTRGEAFINIASRQIRS